MTNNQKAILVDSAIHNGRELFLKHRPIIMGTKVDQILEGSLNSNYRREGLLEV